MGLVKSLSALAMQSIGQALTSSGSKNQMIILFGLFGGQISNGGPLMQFPH